MAIRDDTSFHGKVEGDLRVDPGVRCLVHGMIDGDLVIGPAADVELRGFVAGDSHNRGRLLVFGVVRGFMRDEDDGRTTVVDEWRPRRHRSRSEGRDRRGRNRRSVAGS